MQNKKKTKKTEHLRRRSVPEDFHKLPDLCPVPAHPAAVRARSCALPVPGQCPALPAPSCRLPSCLLLDLCTARADTRIMVEAPRSSNDAGDLVPICRRDTFPFFSFFLPFFF